MTSASRTLTLAVAMLLAIGTLRGGVVTIAKYVSESGAAPYDYVFWTSAVAALILTVIAALRGRFINLTRRYVRYYVVCGALGIVLPNGLFVYVVKFVPAGSMAVILTTVPLLTYTFALLLRIEPFNALRATGIVTGFAGAALIAWPGQQVGALSGYLLLGFLCPAAYSMTGVFASRATLPEKDPLLLACGTTTAAALLALPTAIAMGQLSPLWVAPGLPEFLIVGHGALTATVYTLFFGLVKIAGPVFYSQSAYVIAITGIGWGMLVFDETHGAAFWFATALILCGLTLVNRRQRELLRAAS